MMKKGGVCLEKEILKVFVPPSFEGVTGVAVLEELFLNSNIDVEVEYTKSLDFRDVSRFRGYNNIIVLGIAYMGGNLPVEFTIELNNPFTNFIHVATYGEELPGEHIISRVIEDKDPILDVYEILQTSNMFPYIAYEGDWESGKAKQLAVVANKYRTWTWYDDKVTKYLLAMYNAMGKYMPTALEGKTIQQAVTENKCVIAGQLMAMSEYIKDKIEQTKTADVVINDIPCKLKVVFADRYINEIANRLLEVGYQEAPTVVCVGRATKGTDMFSVRTKGVDAREFIKGVSGKATGKENVGSLFVQINYAELMKNSMVTLLNGDI